MDKLHLIILLNTIAFSYLVKYFIYKYLFSKYTYKYFLFYHIFPQCIAPFAI